MDEKRVSLRHLGMHCKPSYMLENPSYSATQVNSCSDTERPKTNDTKTNNNLSLPFFGFHLRHVLRPLQSIARKFKVFAWQVYLILLYRCVVLNTLSTNTSCRSIILCVAFCFFTFKFWVHMEKNDSYLLIITWCMTVAKIIW